VTYLKDNSLLPDRQSAYRAHHSTETVVLKVLADILLALDTGNLAVLTLLDLSAVFDSVDHETLLRRLQTSYGLGGVVIMVRLLLDRPHTVRPIFGEQFYTVDGGFVRGASGFGSRTDPVPPLYSHAAADPSPPSSSTRLCRRHTDLWVL